MTTRAVFRRRAAFLAAACLAASAIFVALYRTGGGELPGGRSYRLDVVLPTAVALAPDADVRMAGVTVGTVRDVATRAGNAIVAVDLQADRAPVYRNGRASVRLKSLVGENYLELDPGTPSAGPVDSGSVLPLRNADDATQLDEILSALDRPTRRELRTLLDGLGGGLRGRGDELNRLFEASSALVADSRPVMALLAHQRREVARLVDDVGRVMRALGDRRQAIAVLARRSKVAAETVARRDEALARTIDELPPTLGQAGATARRLGSFAPQAVPVVADLGAGLDGLAPVMRELGPAARVARTTVGRLGRFASEGAPLLDRLKEFGEAASRTTLPLDRVLAEVNPLLAYLAPYHRELSAFFASGWSAANTVDATGHVARIHGVLSESSLAGATDEQEAAMEALVDAGALEPIRMRGNNSYPLPGEIANPARFRGEYPRLTRLPLVVSR